MGMLRTLLNEHHEELTLDEVEVFASMQFNLNSKRQTQLTDEQRAWVRSKLEAQEPGYENLVSSGEVKSVSKVPTIEMFEARKSPEAPASASKRRRLELRGTLIS